MEFCSFIAQPHSFDSRQIGRHISALIIWKLSYFREKKNNLRKMEVLQIFGSWNQEIDL